jgi:hypothetical protein
MCSIRHGIEQTNTSRNVPSNYGVSASQAFRQVGRAGKSDALANQAFRQIAAFRPVRSRGNRGTPPIPLEEPSRSAAKDAQACGMAGSGNQANHWHRPFGAAGPARSAIRPCHVVFAPPARIVTRSLNYPLRSGSCTRRRRYRPRCGAHPRCLGCRRSRRWPGTTRSVQSPHRIPARAARPPAAD